MGRKGFALLVGVVCIVVLVVSLSAYAQQKGSAAKTLQIGYVLCANGWFRVMDGVEEKNLKIAAQMLNDRGGITVQGQKYNIQLIGEDGNSSLDGVTAAANKLVFDHKVKFVVGPQDFSSPPRALCLSRTR